MKIDRFVIGMISTNCYLVSNEKTKHAVIIDPAECSEKMIRAIEEQGLEIEAILLTHGHFDHMMGIKGLLEHFCVPVYVHEAEKQTMEDVGLNLSSSYTAGYTFSDARYVKDEQVLKLAGYEFLVLHTPGHTPGGCCYYVQEEHVLFSGDTLFRCSVGRTDFPNGSTSDLVHSVRDKLFQLPDAVRVYPGHMDETEIGYEKNYNPYV